MRKDIPVFTAVAPVRGHDRSVIRVLPPGGVSR